MFRSKIRAALLTVTAIAALALPASALATNVTRWNVTGGGSEVDQGAPYANIPIALFDDYRQANSSCEFDGLACYPESLVYGHETFGVNLKWDTLCYTCSVQSLYQWRFIRQPGRYLIQQIPANEHVALYNSVNQKYLAWACHGFFTGCIGVGREDFGINLYWSKAPQYEWQVAKGGDSSHPNLADLYNDIEKAYLIDHHQTFGVDLGWIHAPFYTGPDYIPPALPVSTPPVSLPGPPRAK